MKKEYQTPKAYKVSFDYKEQLVASPVIPTDPREETATDITACKTNSGPGSNAFPNFQHGNKTCKANKNDLGGLQTNQLTEGSSENLY